MRSTSVLIVDCEYFKITSHVSNDSIKEDRINNKNPVNYVIKINST